MEKEVRLIDANEVMRDAEHISAFRHGLADLSDLAIVLSGGHTIEAEPVVHAKWVDRYGGKYANHLYECSNCKGKALYKIEVDVLDKEQIVQALSAACPHCRAKMDLKAE